VTTLTLLRTRAHRWTITLHLPAVGRKRLIGAASLASTGTVLWLAAPAYLPGADVSAVMVLAGIGCPWSVAWVTLLALERRIARDLVADAQRGHEKAAPR
jgi:hypothetical protein